jgi:lysophospholipase L1-like esterase
MVFLPVLNDLETGSGSNVLKAQKEISRTLNVPLIDLSPDLATRGKALYLDADPVHFNAAGNEIIARRLAETVSKLTAP